MLWMQPRSADSVTSPQEYEGALAKGVEILDFAHRTASRAETLASSASDRLSGHEVICAERYTKLEMTSQSLAARATRVEYLLYGVLFFLLVGEGSVIEVVKRLVFKAG